MHRLLTKISLSIASGTLAILGSIRYTNNLEAQYPIHIPPRHSRLWIPNETDPKRKLYVPDVSPCTFYARVPKSTFPEPFRIEQARNLWPRAFFKGTLMFWEGKAFEWFTGQTTASEDEPYAKGDALAGGMMEVIEPPSVAEHLTARWKVPPEAVTFFETLSKYGYPWRLMEGGRHDFPVVEDGDDVLVGFSAAHDYAVLDNDGKTLSTSVRRMDASNVREGAVSRWCETAKKDTMFGEIKRLVSCVRVWKALAGSGTGDSDEAWKAWE